MPAKPRTIDEFLAAVADDKRASLEKLRKDIKAAAPKAEECISYGLAAFRLDGKPLVAFGAGANHCALYPMSSATVASLADQLKKYSTSKGAIRFPPDRPLPMTLVRKVVEARIAENEARRGEKNSLSSRRSPKSRDHSTSTRRGANRTPSKKRLKKSPASTSSDRKAEEDVAEFLRELEHPLKKDIETVRRIILGASPRIAEGIKWNSLSFQTSEFFATLNWRRRDSVQFVCHKGAKVKDRSTKQMAVSDPKGMVQWLATDRCLVTVGAGKAVQSNRAALVAIVREWIGQM